MDACRGPEAAERKNYRNCALQSILQSILATVLADKNKEAKQGIPN